MASLVLFAVFAFVSLALVSELAGYPRIGGALIVAAVVFAAYFVRYGDRRGSETDTTPQGRDDNKDTRS